jgi:hypothetical protein
MILEYARRSPASAGSISATAMRAVVDLVGRWSISVAVRVCVRTFETIKGANIDRFGTPSLITRNTNDIQQIQLFVQMALTVTVHLSVSSGFRMRFPELRPSFVTSDASRSTKVPAVPDGSRSASSNLELRRC